MGVPRFDVDDPQHPHYNPHEVYYLDKPGEELGWYFAYGTAANGHTRVGPWETWELANAMASTFWATLDREEDEFWH